MLIVCPNCVTSYQVEPQSLGPAGRSVRCTRCQNIWFAAAPLAMVYDLDMLEYEPRVFALQAPEPTDPESPPKEPESRPENTFDLMPPEEPATQSGENLAPERGTTEGIDGLVAEIAGARAALAAAAGHALTEGIAGDITVTKGKSLVPLVALNECGDRPAPATLRQSAEEVEIGKQRPVHPKAAPRRAWPLPSLSAAILALIVANTILIAWRSDVVRLLPQTASLYAAAGMPVNLRGLAFENVKMSRDVHDGVSVLVVEGSLVNVAGRAIEVPRLRLSVRNDTMNEIYTWTTVPARSILGPGETLPFRSRLASPPIEARDVVVRFLSRRDVVAGLR